MSRYNITHSPALEGCRDRVAALEAENARLREARDEAAELRAALERIADWPDGGNLYGQANIKRFAADTLRRLAGGEGEK